MKAPLRKMTIWQAFWACLAIHLNPLNISIIGYEFALLGVFSQILVMISTIGLTLYSFFLIVRKWLDTSYALRACYKLKLIWGWLKRHLASASEEQPCS